MDKKVIVVANGTVSSKPVSRLAAEEWRKRIGGTVELVDASNMELAQRVAVWQRLGWSFGPTAEETLAAERRLREQFRTAPNSITAERMFVRALRADLAARLAQAANDLPMVEAQ